jgi:hypothetical protein
LLLNAAATLSSFPGVNWIKRNFLLMEKRKTKILFADDEPGIRMTLPLYPAIGRDCSSKARIDSSNCS